MKNYCIFFALIFLSCNSQRQEIEFVLKKAGENRQELDFFLKHYKNEPEKLAAARFLIKNMPYYNGMDGALMDSIKHVYKEAVLEKSYYGLNSIIIDDNRVSRTKKIPQSSLSKTNDAQHIQAEHLIKNIDLAFTVWKKYPWNRSLSFDVFCELILPYRIGNEKLSDWRELYYNRYAPLLDSLYQGNDVVEACNTLVRILKKEGFFYNTQFQHPYLDAIYLFDSRIGFCRETCDISLYVMRAVGIPVAVDNRVYSPEGKQLELVEIALYKSIDETEPIQTEIIYKPRSIHSNKKFAIENLIDRNPLSFFLSKDSPCFVGFDLGVVMPIKKIMFIPRNDENFIWPGDLYELFYQNGTNGWASLGQQTATSSELVYKVPKGALLWLHNHTKGSEEQVFFVQNGKQIFSCDIKGIQ